MPPLHPGEPGDGHGEDAHDPDDVGYTPPLPPEDRLWRHPSEVAADRATPAPQAPRTTPDRRTAGLMVLSGLAGATLAVGAVAAPGGFDERVVERQVAAQTSDPGRADEDVAVVARGAAPRAIRACWVSSEVSASAICRATAPSCAASPSTCARAWRSACASCLSSPASLARPA